MNTESMSLNELIEAAKNEDWNFVDERIGQICNNDIYLSWARISGLSDRDGHVRDLAVSIFEKTRRVDFFNNNAKRRLRVLMKYDNNPYVRYRSAFALCGHGDKSSEVVRVLKEALEDEEVADIAKNYLDKI